MSNFVYASGQSLMLGGGLNWASNPYDIYLIDTAAYTPSSTGHTNMTHVAGAAIISGPVALTGKVDVAGAADADDPTFTAVSGPICEAMIIALHTGTAATDTLLLYIDNATGLPITPNGGNIIYVIDAGVNRLFRP